MPLDVRVDDVATLRKPHPCGSSRWRVVRIGADIGLVCLGCGRRIMLTRRVFEKRCKRLEPAEQRGADEPTGARD